METQIESVNHPKHYLDETAPCECIDVIHYIVKNLPSEVSFGIGNLIKYVWRLGKKSPDQNVSQTVAEKILEDLKKAQWYLNDSIEQMNLLVELKI